MNRAEFIALYTKIAWERLVAERGGRRVLMEDVGGIAADLRRKAANDWGVNRHRYTIHYAKIATLPDSQREEIERELRGRWRL